MRSIIGTKTTSSNFPSLFQTPLTVTKHSHITPTNMRAWTTATYAQCADFLCKPPRNARLKWLRGQRKLVLARRGNPYGAGHCWHCGVGLQVDATTGPKWDIDHFPIPFRDIQDQCLCGVTDSRASNNLVPACVGCNRSGKYEAGNQWYYCGRTQVCCLRSVCVRVVWLALGLVMGALVVMLIYATL